MKSENWNTQEENNNVFFERSEVLERFKSQIRKKRFVSVLAPQHVGKSSLIYKGLIPTLKENGYMAKAGTSWKIASFTPKDAPLMELAFALTRPAILYDPTARITPKFEEDILKFLESNEYALIDTYKKYDYVHGHNLLIIVDQFEEVFKENITLEERNLFLRLLINAIKQNDFAIYVVLAIDSENMDDGLAECRASIRGMASDSPGSPVEKMTKTIDELEELIAGSTYQLHTMNQRLLETAIKEYAQKIGGIDMDEGKCLKIVETLYTVQFQLDKIPELLSEKPWMYWATEGIKVKKAGKKNKEKEEPITLKKGKKGAIIKPKKINSQDVDLLSHANSVYESLIPRQRKICQRLFKLVVYINETGEITQRASELEFLSKIIEIASYGEIREVINILSNTKPHSLLSSSSEAMEPDSIISMDDDELLDWDRLKSWIDEEHKLVKKLLAISDNASTFYFNRSVDLWDKEEASEILTIMDEEKLSKSWLELYIYNIDETLGYLNESGKISFSAPVRPKKAKVQIGKSETPSEQAPQTPEQTPEPIPVAVKPTKVKTKGKEKIKVEADSKIGIKIKKRN